MPNIRFPLQKPTSGHPNPYTIDFDFLPYPLDYPLSPEQDPYIYTTKITIDDPDPESARIEHVFPKGKVYFIIDEQQYPNFFNELPTITDQILNNSFNSSLEGIWIHLGNPKDIKALREDQTIQTPFIPTGVIYDSVQLEPHFLQNLMSLIQGKRFKIISSNGDLEIYPDSPIRKSIIIGEWLRGKIGIEISEIDLQNNVILLPYCTIRIDKKQLIIGAFMVDGNGVEFSTMQRIIAIIRHNRITGKLFDPNFDDGQMAIVPMPLNAFLELAPIPIDLMDHPYKLAFNATFHQAIWDAVVFYVGTPSSLARARFNPLGYPGMIVKVDSYEIPISKTAIFYYPNLPGKIISVVNSVTTTNNKIYIIADTFQSGTSLNLSDSQKRNYYYSIGIGNPVSIISANDYSKYFGILPSMENMMTFFEKLSESYHTLLTTAGVFARAMGFLAESVMDYFRDPNHMFRVGNSVLSIEPSNTANIFLAACYNIFYSDHFREFMCFKSYPLVTMYNFEENITGNFGYIINQINSRWNSEDDWLKTHEDHSDNDSRWGWKTWGFQFDDGHKHHFIYSAFSVLRWNFIAQLSGFIVEDVWPNKWEGEDSLIDEQFNEKGREFGFWCITSYDPTKVYENILNLVVENENII